MHPPCRSEPSSAATRVGRPPRRSRDEVLDTDDWHDDDVPLAEAMQWRVRHGLAVGRHLLRELQLRGGLPVHGDRLCRSCGSRAVPCRHGLPPVSYTHLTLPTIYSV